MIDWDKMPGQVITVISDLHSNKRAMEAALKVAGGKRTDQLIILGDVLTYGIDAVEVLDMVQKCVDEGSWLLIGNHDEMYLDLIAGRPGYFPKLRPDLQESILYNINKIDTKQFAELKWKKEIVHDNVYYSHANPYGNFWEYIKDRDDHYIASVKLKQMGHLAGIFGHTHRSTYFSFKKGMLPSIDGLTDDTFVINPGSVGQPRSTPRSASLLRLCSHDNKLWAEIEPIQYDMQAHVDDILKSSLSPYTKSILASFF